MQSPRIMLIDYAKISSALLSPTQKRFCSRAACWKSTPVPEEENSGPPNSLFLPEEKGSTHDHRGHGRDRIHRDHPHEVEHQPC
jgi:hypothetical protein